MADSAGFLAKLLRVITRKRLVIASRLLLVCELAGLGLVAASVWMALGGAAGMAAVGIVLVVVGNSKAS